MLDYPATHPHVKIQYHASDMILMTDTNSAYIVLPYAHSRIADHYYLTERMLDYSKGNPTPNGLILTEFKTIMTVVSSSSEDETGGILENTQNFIPLCHLLKIVFLHPQHK